jgi:hypothetical protein
MKETAVTLSRAIPQLKGGLAPVATKDVKVVGRFWVSRVPHAISVGLPFTV